MTPFRKFARVAALAACMMLQTTPALALNATVTKPVGLDWGRVFDALSDGRLDAGDMVGPAFDAFWHEAGNVISQTQLCREAYARLGVIPAPPPNLPGPFTFHVTTTVVDGNSSASYQNAVRVVPQPDGSLVVGIANNSGGYSKIIRCGSAFTPGEDAGPDGEDILDDADENRGGDGSGGEIIPITSGGADRYDFNTAAGRISVYLPDDIAAGDTITGTIFSQPAGDDQATRASNAGVLSNYIVTIGETATRVSDRAFVYTAPPTAVAIPLTAGEGNRATILAARSVDGSLTAPSTVGVPAQGQAGRPLEIQGPFDGNASNTGVTVGGQPCPILAESPRQVVVLPPAQPTGPTQLSVTEGERTMQAPYRNIGVGLTAPRTNLIRGERTQIHLQVTGLEGLTEPVGVRLRNLTPTAVQLQGGADQLITIQPRQANSDGVFTRNFNLQALQTGTFEVVATLSPSSLP